MTDSLSWIDERVSGFGDREAIIRGDDTTTYADLVAARPALQRVLDAQGVGSSARVAVIGDFGTLSTALILELIRRRAVLIPLTETTAKRRETLYEICDAQWAIDLRGVRETPDLVVERLHAASPKAEHPLFTEIRTREVPGLILFTSGSTGEPKAVVHDFSLLLEKFRTEGRPLRTVNFLLFDHWGGLNTLLHTLTSGGVVTCPESRHPEHICGLIAKHKLELLPASPSFLNMMLVSGAHKRHDLSSLRLVTYGAEPMPETTLLRLNRELPNVEFRQTYGLIELGVLRAKSAASDSLLVKIGGDGYETRVVDGLLEIRARSSMLGYLNAESPFTEDGFFRTGDHVEVHGEYLRILGRESEQINVGGDKVFPSEVEAVLLECPAVIDAVVYGSSHPISGKIVCADVVRVASDRDDAAVRTEIRRFCNERLDGFKVPVKIRFTDGPLTNERQKRLRLGRGSDQQ